MREPASAYAALGLEPGADRPAIEEAYRRLIKLYHPDRSGGDPARASEINRAYFELRQGDGSDASAKAAVRRRPAVRRSQRRRGRGRSRSRLWLVLILAVGSLLLVERARVTQWTRSLADLGVPVFAPGRGSAVPLDSESLDGPLSAAAIDRAIRQAIQLARSGDEDALAARSRGCHLAMRSNPDLAQLDVCAAFDDAAATLVDHDPIDDRGAFSASAVTARQMTAAALLSSDYLAIERRLDRIRMAVEAALVSRTPR
jgi:hypothetical protein